MPRNPPREAKGDSGGNKSETKEEAHEVAGRSHAEVFLRLAEFSREKRPCRAGTVDLVEDGREGAEHLVSVARAGYGFKGGLDRRASEFFPRIQAEGPTRLDQGMHRTR